MICDIVVDLGNTRMKWGRIVDGTLVETVALGRYPSDEWAEILESWGVLGSPGSWLIASVDPYRSETLTEWLLQRNQSTYVLRSFREIPIPVEMETPSGVGLDRLLGCAGALALQRLSPPFLVVQVGTALVVNFIDERGVFVGGAILPGFPLMSKALNERTAQLPVVPMDAVTSLAPGGTTEAAIRLGMLSAALGSIQTLRQRENAESLPVLLTGGDAAILLPHIPYPVELVPDLVLHGLLATAEKLP